MNTNDFESLPWVRSAMVFLAFVPACSAHVLDVGSTGADGGGASSSNTSQAAKYEPGCAVGACGSPSTYGCAGTVVDLVCAPDPNAGVGSDPANSCVFTSQCIPLGTPGCLPAGTSECGADSNGESVCASISGGSGYVTLELNASPSASPTSTLRVYFNHALAEGEGQALGSCAYNPGGASTYQSGVVGAPAPNPGEVTAKGPSIEVSATPACTGLYTTISTAETFAAGDLISFGWSPAAGDPDTFPSSLPTVPAPHPVVLGQGQLLAAAAPSIARGQDLPVSWTVTGTPMALEQVIVTFTQGEATVTCNFDASTGSGVVPSDALLKLSAGAASYEVVSQHAANVDSTETNWSVNFNVNAAATVPGGLAKGTATLN